MKKIILFFLLFGFFYCVNAQGFKLGFDLEAHQVRLSGNQILGGNGLPLSYHLDFTYEPIKNISLLTKIGRTLHIEFAGWEFGIKGKYDFYKSVYASAGLLQHSNEGGTSSNSEGTKFASILMVQTGIGFDFNSVTSIELNYYIATSQKIIGWSRGFDLDGEIYSSYKFQSMIRLGFVFGWEL